MEKNGEKYTKNGEKSTKSDLKWIKSDLKSTKSDLKINEKLKLIPDTSKKINRFPLFMMKNGL